MLDFIGVAFHGLLIWLVSALRRIGVDVTTMIITL